MTDRKNLSLEDVSGFDPNCFSKCIVHYDGDGILSHRKWTIRPEQAMILSDIHVNGPRELSGPEHVFMYPVPSALYDSDMRIATTTKTALDSKYDLLE